MWWAAEVSTLTVSLRANSVLLLCKGPTRNALGAPAVLSTALLTCFGLSAWYASAAMQSCGLTDQ